MADRWKNTRTRILCLCGLGCFILSGSSLSSHALSLDPRLPIDAREQFNADLAFFASLSAESASPLQREIFGGPVGSAASVAFFTSRIEKVNLGDCGNSNAVACVQPGTAAQLWITPHYLKAGHPQVARLLVLYHEARHTESSNGHWVHAFCPVPFENERGEPLRSLWSGTELAGEQACDWTAYGSYGISVVLLKNIQSFCQNCSEKVQMDAGIYADDQTLRILDDTSREEIQNDLR